MAGLRNFNDITVRVRAEVEAWFTRQCREPFTEFYWWYAETTPQRDGGFLIAAEKPANGDYAIAGRLERHLTKDQNIARFLEVVRRLPILSLS